MNPHIADAELRRLVRQALAQGWILEGGSRHFHLVAPDGRRLPIPHRLTDHHARYNLRGQLRRAGLAL